MFTTSWQIRWKSVSLLYDFDVSIAFIYRLHDEGRQRGEVVRPEHDVEMRKNFEEAIAVALSDATANGENALVKRRIGTQRDVLQGCRLANFALVGRLSDAACHEDYQVGLLDAHNLRRSKAFKHADDALGVMLVHLASECLDAESKVVERTCVGRHADQG